MKGSNKRLDPLPHVMMALNEICNDERNKVFVISS